MTKPLAKWSINLGLLILSFLFGNQVGVSVTNYTVKRNSSFVFDLADVKKSLQLPVIQKEEMLRIPANHLELRVKNSVQDETVEPLFLKIENDPVQIKRLSSMLAKPGKTAALEKQIKERLEKYNQATNNNNARNNENTVAPNNPTTSKTRDIRVTADLYNLMEPVALGRIFEKIHHKLSLPGDVLKNDKKLRKSLSKQLKGYLSNSELKKLMRKIRTGDDLNVDEDLLPKFARKMVKKYTIYRGPNCFHSSLAFQSPKLPSSSFVNVKIESGYHRAMINYDELWRILNLNFYEINPNETPLQYGDTIVFFDVPRDGDMQNPDFKWIRHAASYLFGDYTFSKGSKSPNTPYSVKTINEEWQTWQKYSKNLAIKVFRRSSKNVTKKPLKSLTDWLY